MGELQRKETRRLGSQTRLRLKLWPRGQTKMRVLWGTEKFLVHLQGWSVISEKQEVSQGKEIERRWELNLVKADRVGAVTHGALCKLGKGPSTSRLNSP